MGLRFRKSKQIMPGVRLNFSGKSASVSVGPKGLKKTFSTSGRTTTTAGIPGSGISYSSRSGGSGTMGAGRASGAGESLAFRPSSQRPTSPKSKAVALLLCIFFGVIGAHRYYVGKIGTGVLWTFTAGMFGVGWVVDIVTIIAGGFYDCNGRVLRSRLTDDEIGAAEEASAYLDGDPAEAWGRWTDCHAQRVQQERMERAQNGSLTPEVLSRETYCATFIGGDGARYKTTLIGCSCPDFEERGLPCKHMYWLAQQLGLNDSVPASGAGGEA
nr:MAG TPA: TM2 domain [Caudoviricetes sp.]